MEKFSAVIIAYNEEKDIGRCLESLRGIADEIYVLDSFSTDRTEAICREMGVRFEQHVFDGYVSQKNRAIGGATHDFILSLDADEALSDELKAEILRIKARWTHDGYIFNRRNSWCGRWIRFTTLYPDRKLRLFDRRKASWDGLDPHDFVKPVPGARITRVKGDLLHWAIHTLEEQQNKTEQFARISAKAYFDHDRKAGWLSAYTHAGWRWFREYLLRLGFLEGYAGWQIARYSALYAWKKYSYLRVLYGNKS
ncbi:MAG: glycosyltransferase family 2 protein [Bacteroidales bacterium]|jgi:glycosyltransferase involved in cell wall biosynthesis|nr:glycosyltransferase family 2 protein [Bacteroidales bacterium]MDD2571010.1 glycosyltransferase family 2 protein [Bacteroidales bacterium]MDD2813869.1 glycosyltransferase family 2 protein [Bacteroidales bacterium]MDD3384506.1 glycosyltransferase family 2 protein [Bacteroidales bacterium]MDD3811644.1 glycosyltransferase family 2 protein [Bacteroidales bacterium]